ncbi:MAG: chloride channel protein [Proteobacteria bacterium]|nr:chloride channel protein [Pseudomonadota bacterium]
MKQPAVAALYGLVAGMIAAAVLGTMNILTEVIWRGEVSAGRTFLTIMAGGALIAGLRAFDGGKENDLAAQLREVRDPAAFHWRRTALLAAMAIIAVAFGGAIGPEAGTLAVIAELSAIVSLAIARSGAERRFIGEVGAAAALGGLYGSPPGGTMLAGEADEAVGSDANAKRQQLLLFLAALAGLAGFALAARVVLHGGGMRVHLPLVTQPDELRDIFAAALPALFGGAAGLGFVVLLPRLQHLLARCGGTWIQTLLCSAGFAALAASFPVLRFSGHHEIEAMLVWGQSVGMAALLGLAGLKVLCLTLCLAGGWRGGAIFPLIFVGAAAGSSVQGFMPGLDSTVAVLAGISAAATVGMGKPLAAILIVALLVAPLVPGTLCVGALVGLMLSRLAPANTLH